MPGKKRRYGEAKKENLFCNVIRQWRNIDLFIIVDNANLRNNRRRGELKFLRDALEDSIQHIRATCIGCSVIVTFLVLPGTGEPPVHTFDVSQGCDPDVLDGILPLGNDLEYSVDGPTLARALDAVAAHAFREDSLRSCFYIGNTIHELSEVPKCVNAAYKLREKGVILHFGNWDPESTFSIDHELMTAMASTTGGTHRLIGDSTEAIDPSSRIVKWLLQALYDNVAIANNAPRVSDYLITRVSGSGSNAVPVEELSREIQQRYFPACVGAHEISSSPGPLEIPATLPSAQENDDFHASGRPPDSAGETLASPRDVPSPSSCSELPPMSVPSAQENDDFHTSGRPPDSYGEMARRVRQARRMYAMWSIQFAELVQRLRDVQRTIGLDVTWPESNDTIADRDIHYVLRDMSPPSYCPHARAVCLWPCSYVVCPTSINLGNHPRESVDMSSAEPVEVGGRRTETVLCVPSNGMDSGFLSANASMDSVGAGGDSSVVLPVAGQASAPLARTSSREPCESSSESRVRILHTLSGSSILEYEGSSGPKENSCVFSLCLCREAEQGGERLRSSNSEDETDSSDETHSPLHGDHS